MNYSDFPDLQVDDFCGTRFGASGQLEVIGWSSRNKYNRKSYVLHCSECAKDRELNGDGIFCSTRQILSGGCLPCLCSKQPRRTASQSEVIIRRKFQGKGVEFVGWCAGEDVRLSKRKVILRCDKHGEWSNATVNSILRGSGCPECGITNEHCVRSLADYETEARRNLAPPYKFIALSTVAGSRRGKRHRVHRDASLTRCWCECPVHGEWETSVCTIIKGTTCPMCAWERNGKTRGMPDDTWIERFKQTGRFETDDIFIRDKEAAGLWHVSCSVCNTTNIQRAEYLLQGHKKCECSSWNQKEAYIHVVHNSDNPIAVKFGIANVSKERLTTQNRRTHLDVRQCSTWYFESTIACKAAEAECKRELECGILSKTEMPDGWTETTYLYNIPAIEAIYRKHGGVRI